MLFISHAYVPNFMMITSTPVLFLGVLVATAGLLYLFIPNWLESQPSVNTFCYMYGTGRHDGYIHQVVMHIFLILLKSVCLVLICYSQVKLVQKIKISQKAISVSKDSRHTGSRSQLKISIKVFLFTLIHMTCWFPIIVIQCFELFGYTFSAEFLSWVAVTIFPLGAISNPFIYTFLQIQSWCRKKKIH